MGGWVYANMVGDAGPIVVARYALVLATPFVMPRPGSIVAFSVAISEARTAGTATFEVTKNTAATGITVVFNATNTQYHYSNPTVPAGFVPGDQINVICTTAGWTPTTADAEATVWVEIEGGTQPPTTGQPT